MDRCRCPDYEAAVKKLRFFTVGTYRPDIIDNHVRGEYYTTWIRNPVDFDDLRFSKPKAHKQVNLDNLPENKMSERSKQMKKMWCPYMSPVKRQLIEKPKK